MKRFIYSALAVLVIPVAACNQPNPAPPKPPPAPNKPDVNVQAPGVEIKSDKQGTTVRTPAADIDVNKK